MKINTTTDQKISPLLPKVSTLKSISIKNIKEQFHLFDHQVEGVNFLVNKKRAVLAHSMGLGKTRQAIIAGGISSEGTILVICPASLKINWEREIHMIYPEDLVVIISSDTDTDLERAAWIIVNYDILAKRPMLKEKVEDGTIETIILDEAHYIKNSAAVRTKATLAIVEKAKQVYCLTGTPVMNKPIEMFSLLRAVRHPLATHPDVAPSTLRTNFSKRYCNGHLETIHRRGGQILRFWDESGANRLPELKELTQDVILRRTKEEVLDLPPKIVSVVEMELGPEWQRTYDHAWDEYLEYIAKNPMKKDYDNILNAQSLVELIKLKQVCSQAKVLRIVADIENMIEQGEKVIVFSQFTETVKRIHETLRAHKIQSVTLTGSDSMEDRQRSVDAFQKIDDVKVFISNIKAGGVGITLTAANHVIFADMDWSPAIHNQAEDRAHRIGQTGTVNVYYYVLSGTIEEDIMDILSQKQETVGTLLGDETIIPAFLDLIIKRARE